MYIKSFTGRKIIVITDSHSYPFPDGDDGVPGGAVDVVDAGDGEEVFRGEGSVALNDRNIRNLEWIYCTL